MGMEKITTLAYGFSISDEHNVDDIEYGEFEGVEIVGSGEYGAGEYLLFCNKINMTDEGGLNVIKTPEYCDLLKEFKKVESAYESVTGEKAKFEDFQLHMMNSYF